MAWALQDLMSEATTIAGTPPGLPTSRVSEVVNRAIRDVSVRLPQVELEVLSLSNTSADEDKIYLPSDCEHVLGLSFNTGVSGVGGRGIRQAAEWEFDAKSSGTETGVPVMFLSYASWVELYPSPDSAYSILLRYKRRPSDITSLTARSSLDTRYDQAVLYKTVEYLHLRKGEYDNVLKARAMYEEELRQMPNLYAIRQQNRAGMGLRYQTKED